MALHLYDKASWVASVLDSVTYYTDPRLPLLGEALVAIEISGEQFFQYSVAEIQDEHIQLEELEEHFRRLPDVPDD